MKTQQLPQFKAEIELAKTFISLPGNRGQSKIQITLVKLSGLIVFK
jgi:hypothetical protein